MLTKVCTLTLLAVVSGACHNATEPLPTGEIAIVMGGDAGQVLAIAVPEGRIAGRVGSLPRFQDSFARSSDGAALFLIALNSITDRSLFTIDLTSFRLIDRRAVVDIDSRSQIGPIALMGNYALAFVPEGERLLVADTQRGSDLGIGAVDLAADAPVQFIGPLLTVPGGLVTLPPGDARPRSVVIALGVRVAPTTSNPAPGFLYVLNGGTLQVEDSAAIGPVTADARGSLTQLLVAPNGRDLYVRGMSEIYKYDLVERRLEATTALPANGFLAISPDGMLLYLSDAGDGREIPGSGSLHIFDAELRSIGAIDLRAAAINGVNPVLGAVAVSRDGKYLYVISGTAERGPLFGPQPRRLLIVDSIARVLLRVVPLGDWGGGSILLR